MSREEEQFNIIRDGIISHIEDLQLQELIQNYKPKYDNSDISNHADVEDYSSSDRSLSLEDVKSRLIDQLTEVFPKDNKALIMINKIVESYSGR